jgi:hypothetical protein
MCSPNLADMLELTQILEVDDIFPFLSFISTLEKPGVASGYLPGLRCPGPEDWQGIKGEGLSIRTRPPGFFQEIYR